MLRALDTAPTWAVVLGMVALLCAVVLVDRRWP